MKLEGEIFKAGTPCPDCGGHVIHTGDLIECLDCGKCERDGSVSIDQLIEDDTITIPDVAGEEEK